MGGGYHGGFGTKPFPIQKTQPDFYVGENGQVLLAKYKHWIGVNKRNSLLKKAKNAKLRNAIDKLYRKGSFIGDGGTASVLKFEKRTGLNVSKAGHIEKARGMKKYLERIIANEPLNQKDRKTARTLLISLRKAILEWEDRI